MKTIKVDLQTYTWKQVHARQKAAIKIGKLIRADVEFRIKGRTNFTLYTFYEDGAPILIHDGDENEIAAYYFGKNQERKSYDQFELNVIGTLLQAFLDLSWKYADDIVEQVKKGISPV